MSETAPVSTSSPHMAEETSLKRNKQFRSLLSGYFLSGLGDQFYTVAIPLLVYDLTKSVLASSTLTAVEFLPTALFGLFIGVLLDRYSRKKLMVYGLLIQALLVAAVPLLMQQGWLPFWSVYVLVFIMATSTIIVMTGYEVILPSIVPKEQLVPASASVNYAATIVRMGGPAFAGFVIALVGYTTGLVVDAVTFGLYAFIISRMTLLQPKRPQQSMVSDFKQGLRFVWKDKILRPLIGGFFVANVGFGLAIPLLMFTMRDVFHVNAGLIGLFFTVSSLGGFFGNTLYLRLNKKLAVGHQMIWTGSIVTIGFLLMGLFMGNFILFMISYALVTLGSMWAQGNFYVIAQMRSPEAYRGRTAATSRTLSRIAGPVMAVLAGVLANDFQLASVYIVSGVIMFLSMLISWIGGLWAVRDVKPADQDEN